MNHKHLEQILEQYIARFDELNDVKTHDEGYKWRAESCFKEHWDIDAEDFQSMFLNAMKETSNLIDNRTVQPIGGIRMLLSYEEEVEYVRECFRELFTEDAGDLINRQDRMDEFIKKINLRIEKYASGSWKYPQSRGNVIYYLNLWRPEQNYIYKATEATAWAACIEFDDDFGSGKTFSLEKYYKMCDELLDAIKENKELLKLHEERMKKEARGFDDQLHILIYDIIYCAHTYNFYVGMKIPKMSAKARVKKTQIQQERENLELLIREKEEKIEILENKKITYPDMTGELVVHQRFGEGKVVCCEGTHLKVEFNGVEKIFQMPTAFLKKFLSCKNEKYIKIFQNNEELDKQLATIHHELSSNMAKLQKM